MLIQRLGFTSVNPFTYHPGIAVWILPLLIPISISIYIYIVLEFSPIFSYFVSLFVTAYTVCYIVMSILSIAWVIYEDKQKSNLIHDKELELPEITPSDSNDNNDNDSSNINNNNNSNSNATNNRDANAPSIYWRLERILSNPFVVYTYSIFNGVAFGCVLWLNLWLFTSHNVLTR